MEKYLYIKRFRYKKYVAVLELEEVEQVAQKNILFRKKKMVKNTPQKILTDRIDWENHS